MLNRLQNTIFSQLSAEHEISAALLNRALIRTVTIFCKKLNKNACGTSMQTIKQLKHCWYLDFFVIYGLLIVKNDVLFLFWKETSKVLSFNIVYFLTLK